VGAAGAAGWLISAVRLSEGIEGAAALLGSAWLNVANETDCGAAGAAATVGAVLAGAKRKASPSLGMATVGSPAATTVARLAAAAGETVCGGAGFAFAATSCAAAGLAAALCIEGSGSPG
jgi:hypothetical protein